jgi:hypothetical protein
MVTVSWLRTHRKQIIMHTSIIVGFVLFTIFVMVPLFDSLELSSTSILQKSSLPRATDNISYVFDRVENDKTQETITIMGIAFIGGLNTTNSHTFVCLKSYSDNYVVDTDVVWRPDVTEDYAYLNLNLDLSGFRAVIPLRKIKDGTYKVGILITKDDIKALSYTYMIITKFGHTAEFPLWISKAQEISLPAISQPVKFHIDGLKETVKEGKEYTEINGWAFIEGQSVEQGQSYIVLKSTTRVYVFDTWPNYTPWVPPYFGITDLGLEWAGFFARIPEEQLESGTYEVGIYIKKGNIAALQYTDDAGNQHSLTIPFLN